MVGAAATTTGMSYVSLLSSRSTSMTYEPGVVGAVKPASAKPSKPATAGRPNEAVEDVQSAVCDEPMKVNRTEPPVRHAALAVNLPPGVTVDGFVTAPAGLVILRTGPATSTAPMSIVPLIRRSPR